jgi:hypothetical protein
VEVLIDIDDGDVPIGTKRDRLLRKSAGKYICFIDDDDDVSPNYIETLLHGCHQDKDAVGILVERYLDGKLEGHAHHSHFNLEWLTKNDGWEDNPKYQHLKFKFTRYINHLCPVKRDIALRVGFLPLSIAEDINYADGIRDLIQTEYMCDQEPIYFYHQISHKHRGHERTNLNNMIQANRNEKSLGAPKRFEELIGKPWPKIALVLTGSPEDIHKYWGFWNTSNMDMYSIDQWYGEGGAPVGEYDFIATVQANRTNIKPDWELRLAKLYARMCPNYDQEQDVAIGRDDQGIITALVEGYKLNPWDDGDDEVIEGEPNG